ncbi:hypothetical protein [Rufibacter roseus]|uniref:Uncharacterized protein n=1 Tax=Rufibacter roseus TaxID=1567108 RepID=A0ABW2DJS7_9BACT|nr:hypothetical protein [Rufibacter roseus]
MNTRWVLAGSALVMGAIGMAASFLPHEILQYLGAPAVGIYALLLQLMGSLYLGFGILNWMSRRVLIGGIYARPLAMGNFLHFFVGAMALIKALPVEYLPLISIYAIFAALFGVICFRHPVAVKEVEPVVK